jgi:hypothetical protein
MPRDHTLYVRVRLFPPRRIPRDHTKSPACSEAELYRYADSESGRP